MASAVERALALPELLAIIFQCLENDLPSLHSAILVSRTWYDQAYRVIWSRPDADAFRFVSPERRQHHASEVKALAFPGRDITVHAEHDGLKWPRLQSLSFRSDFTTKPPPEASVIGGYFQPSLKELELSYLPFHYHLIHALHTQCPRLRKLDISTNDRYQAGLPALLEPLEDLDDISLRFAGRYELPRDLVCYLARRRPLKALSLMDTLSINDVECLKDNVKESFWGLTKLKISLDKVSLPALVPLIKHLTHLDLEIPFHIDGEVDIISRLTPMQNLEVLKIGYPKKDFLLSATVRVEDLLALKSFPKLRELQLLGSNAFVECPDLTPTKLQDILSALPQLRVVNLYLGEEIFEDDLVVLTTLAKCCKHLEECDLVGNFKLEELANFQAPLFPALTKMSLAVTTLEPITPEDKVLDVVYEQILRHAPDLRSMRVEYDESSLEKGDADDDYWRGRRPKGRAFYT